MSVFRRLYQGQFQANIIGHRRRYYALSGVVVAVCILSMIFRGFSFGIDFKGGALFQFPAHGQTVEQAKTMLSDVGISPTDSVVQELTTSKQLRVQTPTLTDAQTNKVQNAIVARFGVKPNDIDISTVGASWGSTITDKALQGLVVFLLLVALYLSIRYEWKMAASAMVALVHDLVVTAGVYSLVGFEVTPSTVIALLTILGFSLYDTVVVFDKVRENTATLGPAGDRTYAEAANDALNQTLMRSINTSLVALIPVASLLFVGAGLLGAGTLEDLALAQFVGLASGAYSSLFVATPLLVDLKNREPKVRELSEQVGRKRDRDRDRERKRAAQTAAVTGGGAGTAVLERGDGPPHQKQSDLDAGGGPQPEGGPPADEASYAASGSRPTGAARSRPPGAAGRRPASRNNRGRGGRPGGKRRR